MGVAMQMVADGRADAMISAGSTAALVMGGTLTVSYTHLDVYKRQCEKPAKLEGKNYMAVVAPKAAAGGKKAKKDADKTAETK